MYNGELNCSNENTYSHVFETKIKSNEFHISAFNFDIKNGSVTFSYFIKYFVNYTF